MKVLLLSHTPEPEKLIAGAAKLCYSAAHIEDLMQGLTAENIDKFLNNLIDLGHESPLEHVSFTFGIEGVSRALTHQLVRHRIASYSQKSQRYVNEIQFEYIFPHNIANNPHAKYEYIELMEHIQDIYGKIHNLIKQDLIEKGISEKDAEKLANDDARYILPNACETKLAATMNARSLLNFFEHRCCNRAQDEIRDLADTMLEMVQEIAPVLFKNAGASCTHGKCKEGKMTCGNPRR